MKIFTMASETITTPTGGDTVDENERNPDGLPYSDDPSGPCPRCGRVSNFTVGNSVEIRKQIRTRTGFLPPQKVVVLTCQGCQQGTVVVEEVNTRPPRVTRDPLYWWPTPGAATTMVDVPDDLAGAYTEGVKCLSVEAPHAAVAMFRNALAHIVHDKGSETARKKNTLNLAIQQMVDDKTLFEGFYDWATQIRTMGNAGAHQESWEEIPIEDARDLQKITLALIENLYVRPAEIARMQKPTKRPKGT